MSQTQHDFAGCGTRPVGQNQPYIAALQGRAREQPAQLVKGPQGLHLVAIQAARQHRLAAAESRALRHRALQRARQHRAGLFDTAPVDDAIQGGGQQQVDQRTGCDDRGARRQRLVVERQMSLVGGDGAFALVEHLHIATAPA